MLRDIFYSTSSADYEEVTAFIDCYKDDNVVLKCVCSCDELNNEKYINWCTSKKIRKTKRQFRNWKKINKLINY